MCLAARRVFYIKDLKDLANETARFSIDIKVLKDLKRGIETGRALLPTTIAGDRPPRYGEKKRSRGDERTKNATPLP